MDKTEELFTALNRLPGNASHDDLCRAIENIVYYEDAVVMPHVFYRWPWCITVGLENVPAGLVLAVRVHHEDGRHGVAFYR